MVIITIGMIDIMNIEISPSIINNVVIVIIIINMIINILLLDGRRMAVDRQFVYVLFMCV